MFGGRPSSHQERVTVHYRQSVISGLGHDMTSSVPVHPSTITCSARNREKGGASASKAVPLYLDSEAVGGKGAKMPKSASKSGMAGVLAAAWTTISLHLGCCSGDNCLTTKSKANCT